MFKDQGPWGPKEPDDSGGGGSERGLKGLYEGLHTRLTCMISHTITYGRIRDLPEIGVGGDAESRVSDLGCEDLGC